MFSQLQMAGCLALALLLAGCTGVREPLAHGANVLQDPVVSLESEAAGLSFRELAAVGADHAALVVFMEQPAIDSPAPVRGEQVTDSQLVAGLRHARSAGLQTVLRPLVLVEGSWAGEIAPVSEQAWFASYRENLLHYARIAEQESVYLLVIGTELSGLARSREWPGVIEAIRAVYRGKLGYAAHGVAGLENFAFWSELDVIGVTLYPSLDRKGRVRASRRAIRRELRAAASVSPGPIWLMEFGVPSADGGQESPWDWRRLERPDVAADEQVQLKGLEAWLDVLEAEHSRFGIEQATLWSWSSNPDAGGYGDKDYTPQNKPSGFLLACRWSGNCQAGRGD